MFGRLGSWCFRRRRIVLLAWIVGVVLIASVSNKVGGNFGQNVNPPGFESTRGLNTLKAEFGGTGAGLQGTLVYRADQGLQDPQVKAGIEAQLAMIEKIAADPKVDVLHDPTFASLSPSDRRAVAGEDLTQMKGMTVDSPYATGGEPRIATTGPNAGKIGFASIEVPGDDWNNAGNIGTALQHLAPTVHGLRTEIGGEAFGKFKEPSSETLGIAFAVVILVVAFGSVLAMGLPIGVALAGIAAGSVIVTLLSHLLTMPDFAPFLGVMIGLGVGIDYALFIVTRYRENLHHGHTAEEAAAIAVDTAGRAVTFAGVTVVISFLGMLVMGVSFIQGLAVASATVVAMTVLASLTLLPAFLGFADHRIEVTRWRGVVATGFLALGLVGAGLRIGPLTILGFGLAVMTLLAALAVRPLRREVPRRAPKPIERTFAYRWSRMIQHHPWRSAGASALFLLVLALPVLHLRLGFSDEGNAPKDTTTRQAYDLLSDGFGKGFNGPFLMVVKVDGPQDPAVLDGVTKAVAADPDVAFASPAIPNKAATTAYLWRVTPKSSPQDPTTTQLVHRLRDKVLVPAEAQLGHEIDVTGQVPGTVDFSNYLAARMPYFFLAVLVLSFLLLMAVFRSVLVPLKAVLMNLLSIGAAYGVMVMTLQWGWFGSITGLAPGPIETFAPMMLFAIVFGLSMDYEVFLLSRVREEWHRTGDSHTSVANGLAATARVITAAAAIMVFVFGSFLLENDRTFKMFGIGLATAILLDATVVRMLLVPATMELLGDRNWWLPRWLDRLLPNIDVEGHPDPVDEVIPERELEPV